MEHRDSTRSLSTAQTRCRLHLLAGILPFKVLGEGLGGSKNGQRHIVTQASLIDRHPSIGYGSNP